MMGGPLRQVLADPARTQRGLRVHDPAPPSRPVVSNNPMVSGGLMASAEDF